MGAEGITLLFTHTEPGGSGGNCGYCRVPVCDVCDDVTRVDGFDLRFVIIDI